MMLSPPPVVLAAEGLRKSYGPRIALKDVSLDAKAGERVACIGPNGAGKTTLLTILAGIQEPDAGTVRGGGRRCRPSTTSSRWPRTCGSSPASKASTTWTQQ